MQNSMGIFCGSELAFQHTYFSLKHSRTVQIKTDAPVQSLLSTEVAKSAGYFCFPDEETQLGNRFIIWRADGSNLYLDEVSTERDLQNASLSINFSQSIIIPGTKLLFSKFVLLLVVPCQSGIHLFHIHLAGEDRRLTITQGVFGLFPNDQDLPQAHTFHPFRNNGVGVRADAAVSNTGCVLVGVCLHDKQLVSVQFQSSVSHQHSFVSEEVVLQGNNMFNRIFKGKSAWSDTWDVAVLAGELAEPVIYSVHQDGMLRCWSGNSQSLNFNADIMDFLREETASKIVDISLKASRFSKTGNDFLILRVQIADHNRFVLLENVHNKLKFRFSSKLEKKFVTDFMCTPTAGGNHQEFCLWAIFNVSFTGQGQEDNIFQPYALTKCAFSLTDDQDPMWEEVQSVGKDSNMNTTLFNFSEIEAVKNRIFDGNNYSFAVVSRAVQIACKQPREQLEYNDWTSLADFVDDFVVSGHFKQIYLNAEDGSSLLKFNTLKEDKLKVAVNNFWEALLKCCNQLQEADLQPLSFLHSPNLGLVGVIQLCRFTIYLPPDELMRAICLPNNRVVYNFFQIVQPFMKTGHLSARDTLVDDTQAASYLDVNSTLETITNHTDELCRMIRAFAEHRPVDVASKLADAKSSYLASSFSTGFLATALRHRIMGRLRLADMINKLVSIVPQILAISTEARTNPKLDLVISAHNSTISQIISYYAVMWISLSVRLVTQQTLEKRIAKQMSVAQAYFKYGGSSLVKKLPNTALLVQDMEEEEEEDEETDLPPSRWDDSTRSHLPSPSSLNSTTGQEKPFQKFVKEIMAGSIIALWPESTSLTLPRFLAENGFFDALKHYCSLNEPFVSELAFALRFFQAIAFSGLGNPELAWKAFDEICEGVLAGDDALNSLLGLMMCSNNFLKPVKEKHSLVEYYNEVMLLFKAHGHTSHVILAANKAVHCAMDGDPLLPDIFTTLFTQQLLSKNFREAVRTLLINPSKDKQSACLRQLLTFLLDNKDTRTLVYLSYDQLTDVVVDILETRCRSDAVSQLAPNIYDVVFAFHVSRCDYTKAAKIMYEYASRLKEEMQTRELLEKRCQVLATAFQTLGIAEPAKRVLQLESTSSCHPCQSQSDASTSSTFGKLLTLTREDIGKELVQAEARLELLDLEPLCVPPTNYKDILRESLNHKRYDMAWVIIWEFRLHPYALLEEVTKQAILADHTLSIAGECDTQWAMANRQFLIKTRGRHASHWKIVISYVELALQHWPHDSKILRTVACVFLGYSVKIPAWLETKYKAVNFGDFLRSLLDFGDLEDAFKQLLAELDAAMSKVTAGKLDIIVPYTHIDGLFYLASKADSDHLPLEETRKKLSKLSNLYDSIRKATCVVR